MALAREPVPVEATVTGGERVALQAQVLNEQGRPASVVRLRPADEGQRAQPGPLAPGAYQVVVGGVGATAARVEPVTSPSGSRGRR